MIACPDCHTVMPAHMANSGKFHQCPNCQKQVMADLYNAFFRSADQPALGGHVQEQGQAECFYHPGKEAVVPCAGCGRLLCALCEVNIGDQSLCMQCLSAQRTGVGKANFENSRLLYDNLAVYLAFLPLLFIFITIVTAPAVIYIVLRYWNAPSSILPRTRIRFLIALIMAVIQVAGWVILLVWAIHSM